MKIVDAIKPINPINPFELIINTINLITKQPMVDLLSFAIVMYINQKQIWGS